MIKFSKAVRNPKKEAMNKRSCRTISRRSQSKFKKAEKIRKRKKIQKKRRRRNLRRNLRRSLRRTLSCFNGKIF